LRFSISSFASHFLTGNNFSEYLANQEEFVRLTLPLSAPHSSTIIEECITLVQNLHGLREWHGIVNSYLQSHLSAIVTFHKPTEGGDLGRDSGIAAALTLIGGFDSRVRIGGNVLVRTSNPGNLLKTNQTFQREVL